MKLEFAQQEAQRRTRELQKPHYVYQSLVEIDEYLVTGRELTDGRAPVYSIFVDGSELEA